MNKHRLAQLLMVATLATSAFAGVSVTAPFNNSTVSPTVQYVAIATTSCAKGVAAMGIYTAPYQLAYTVNGASLNTLLHLTPNTTYHTTVEAWDNCGGASTTAITIHVGGQTSNVLVAAPLNYSTVAPTVQFVATATTGCPRGVAAMGIYTAPYQLAYTVNGASLNTLLHLTPNTTYYTTVEEWDNCGGAASTPITIKVGGGGGGNTFSNLQQQGGWNGYALLPPSYNICNSCSPGGPQLTWSRTTGIGSPSLSGSSTRHDIGGQTKYSDGLWNNHLIGDFSTQGMPDSSKTLVPSLHNFTYDVYFYASNITASQALEFDINQFFGGMSFIWGHECRIAGGNQWDVWDNVAQQWHPTGVACNPLNNAWNHLVLQVQRTSDNHVLFQSITLNGQTANLNYYTSPTASNWFGITINYQQDGNYAQQPYSIWLDKLNFTYW